MLVYIYYVDSNVITTHSNVDGVVYSRYIYTIGCSVGVVVAFRVQLDCVLNLKIEYVHITYAFKCIKIYYIAFIAQSNALLLYR